MVKWHCAFLLRLPELLSSGLPGSARLPSPSSISPYSIR